MEHGDSSGEGELRAGIKAVVAVSEEGANPNRI